MGQLAAALGKLVYVDANIVVYAVEGYEAHERTIKQLLSELDAGDLVGLTSDLTLAEVLVKPKRDANAALEAAYRHFLEPSEVMRSAPITREVLIEAAAIRATTRMKLPDAIHVATAVTCGCSALLTNDERLRATAGIPVRFLSELSQ